MEKEKTLRYDYCGLKVDFFALLGSGGRAHPRSTESRVRVVSSENGAN